MSEYTLEQWRLMKKIMDAANIEPDGRVKVSKKLMSLFRKKGDKKLLRKAGLK